MNYNKQDNTLKNILNTYTDENHADLLPDGSYITNVWCHPKGERERKIEIINGVVHVPDSNSKNGTMKFSQSSFFGEKSNIVVRKL